MSVRRIGTGGDVFLGDAPSHDAVPTFNIAGRGGASRGAVTQPESGA